MELKKKYSHQILFVFLFFVNINKMLIPIHKYLKHKDKLVLRVFFNFFKYQTHYDIDIEILENIIIQI